MIGAWIEFAFWIVVCAVCIYFAWKWDYGPENDEWDFAWKKRLDQNDKLREELDRLLGK